jgi:hypothetical protein
VALPFRVGGVGPVEPVASVADVVVLPVEGVQAEQLDLLMRQALSLPGAASALLEAYAAQSRALRLVQEAEARGAARLPAELRLRLESAAARTPTWLAATVGVRT